MKRRSCYGLREKKLSIALVAIVCMGVLFWGWEKTPLIATLPTAHGPLNVLHSETHEENLSVAKVDYKSPEPYKEEDFSAAATVRESHKGETRNVSGIGPTSSTTIKLPDIRDLGENSMTMTSEKKGSVPISLLPLRNYDNSTSMIMQNGSVTTSSHKSRQEEHVRTTVTVGKNECNYGKGQWVEDKRRPLYSGSACKQWLSNMWSCRLTQRTDFSYEKFRWKPDGCEMPEFDVAASLKRMKDKTIALVGDSLGRQQFQSLMCMLTGGKASPKVKDVGREYGLYNRHGLKKPNGWAYRFQSTNTTILYYWSASLSEIEPLNISDPSTNYAMHLDRPTTFLKDYIHRFDVLVLNTGHHWNRRKFRENRWEMYVGGLPNKNRNLATMGSAKNFTIYAVVKWLDSQLPKHPQLKAFFRTISPRHFVNGEWNTGGNCDNTRPLTGGSRVLQSSSSDADSHGAVKGTRVNLLDITSLSQLRDEAHISRYSAKSTNGVHDCLHWCLPGIPDTWNEILIAQI